MDHCFANAFDKFVKNDEFARGRVEHTLHELLNSLLEDYSQAVGVLVELRNACNTKAKAMLVENLVY